MHGQLNNYSDMIPSKYWCRFCKGFNTQWFFPTMTEKLQKSFDGREVSAIFLTDLFEAFDFLLHDSLIEKSDVYVVKKESRVC